MHGPVQDEWQGEAGLRFELRGRSALPCARCRARLRIRSTRLSMPAATRMRGRFARKLRRLRDRHGGMCAQPCRLLLFAVGSLPNRMLGRCKTDGNGEAGLRFNCLLCLRRRAHGAVQCCASEVHGCRCRWRRECKIHVRTSELRRVLAATEVHGTVAVHTCTGDGRFRSGSSAAGDTAGCLAGLLVWVVIRPKLTPSRR